MERFCGWTVCESVAEIAEDLERTRTISRFVVNCREIRKSLICLTVKPAEVIDSSFYFLRFLSEITISCGGSAERTTVGLTEFIAPKSLKYRWLNWLADIRTGKDGRSSYF